MKRSSSIKHSCILIVITACILLFPILCLKLPYYEVDDYLMNYIANGSLYGETINLIYPNYMFGIILSSLYSLVPGVNWYAVVLLVTLSFALALGFWLARQLQNKIFMIVVVCICMLVPFYLTFTVVAYLSVAMGTAGILYFVWHAVDDWLKFVYPILLVIWGICIRKGTLLSTLVLFLPIIILLLIQEKLGKKEWIGLSIGALLLLGVLAIAVTWNVTLFLEPLLCIIALTGWLIARRQNIRFRGLFRSFLVITLSIIIMNSFEVIMDENQGWKDFRSYTSARSNVLDYPYVSYGDAGSELQEIGISETDYGLLWKWIFIDKKTYSEEKLLQIAQVLKKYPRQTVAPQNICRPTVLLCYGIPVMFFFILWNWKNRENKGWIQGLSVLILWGLYMLLWLRRRYVFRVTVPLCIVCVVQMLLVSGFLQRKDSEQSKRNIVCVASVCILLVVCQYVYTSNNITMERNAKDSDYMVIKEYVEETDEKLFLVDSSLYNMLYYTAEPIMSVDRTDIFSNVVKSGGGDSFSKRHYNQMQDWGIREPDRTMVMLALNENMRYIGNEGESMKKYLEEQLNQNILMEIEKSFENGVEVYNYRIEQAGL